MELHLRVHTEFISQDTLCEWVRKYCESYYVALEEDAQRPHFQAYIKTKPDYKNVNSLRNSLKKLITSKGNAVYSLRGLKKPKVHLVCYLLKENKPIMKCIEVGLLKEAEALQEEILSKKSNTDRHRPIMEQLLEVFPARGRAYSQEEMVSGIVRWFHDNGRMQPDMFMLGKYVRTLCASFDIDRYVQVAQAEFKDKFQFVQILNPPEFFSQDITSDY